MMLGVKYVHRELRKLKKKRRFLFAIDKNMSGFDAGVWSHNAMVGTQIYIMGFWTRKVRPLGAYFVRDVRDHTVNRRLQQTLPRSKRYTKSIYNSWEVKKPERIWYPSSWDILLKTMVGIVKPVIHRWLLKIAKSLPGIDSDFFRFCHILIFIYASTQKPAKLPLLRMLMSCTRTMYI